MSRFYYITLSVFLLSGLLTAASALDPGPDRGEKYWIFFTDKGASSHMTKERLSPRARARRLKVLGPGMGIDETDQPLHEPYVRALKDLGLEPVVRSKWLNGISVYVSQESLGQILQLPFISRVQKVGRAWRELPQGSHLYKSNPLQRGSTLDYGPSFTQNELVRIPDVHRTGLIGEGVLIAVLDTGFDLNHEAFQHLNVVAAYDFINKDNIVSNEDGQDRSGQESHGTTVLSILAGYRPGQLIGPAYGADFLLAKTEQTDSETQAEEDYWIAAAEWAERLGAEVINSSLGYLDWYTYSDMDGNTAPITRAADLAVKKGIVVVTSAGNEGDSPWYYINAPADGDSVISVGAVTLGGLVAGFSSRGPTYDGRIKPDVVAMGVDNVGVIAPAGEELGVAYRRIKGTSVSAPFVSGVAALILSAHPSLTPMQVRTALLNTADRALTPNNTYGYGLINAYAAVNHWEPGSAPTSHGLLASYPNPFHLGTNPLTRILFNLSESANITLEIYNLLGQKIYSIWNGPRAAGEKQQVLWDGTDQSGRRAPSGIYLCRMQAGKDSWLLKITLLH